MSGEVPSMQDEVAGLDRVLSRLAMTDEDKLEKVLSKLIPAVIGALKSPHEATRKKVMEILSHVNKRIKGQGQIKLPVAELLVLYVDTTQAAMVRNFSLVYLETAFDRADATVRLSVVGPLILGLSTRAAGHQTICLRLALAAMDGVTQPNVHPSVPTPEVLAKYPFLECAADRGALLKHLLKALQYQPPRPVAAAAGGVAAFTPLGVAMALQAAIAAGGPQAPPVPTAPLPPAGLCANDVRVLEEKAAVVPLPTAMLAKRKVGILNFLATAAPPPSEVLLHLLVAACDPADAVSRRGEELVKKVCSLDTIKPTVDLEDRVLLARLFSLFHGQRQDEGAPPVPEGTLISPAGPALRSRLLQLLTKSVTATNMFPDTLRTIYEAVSAPTATQRLKAQGMEFAMWVFKHAERAQLQAMGPTVLQGLLRTLDQESGAGGPAAPAAVGAAAHGGGGSGASTGFAAVSLRGFAYQAVSGLAVRLPELLQSRGDVAQRFFAALETEPAGLRATVQEAVSSLAQAYRGLVGEKRDEIDKLLLESVTSPKDAVRVCAVQWAVKLHPWGHVPARYICVVAAGDVKHELRDEALKGLRLHPTSLAAAAAAVAGGAAAAPAAGSAAAAAAEEAWPEPGAILEYVRQQLPRLRDVADPNRPLPLPARSFLALIQLMQGARKQAATLAAMAAVDPEVLPDASRSTGSTIVADYTLLLEHALVREASSELVVAALQALLDVAAEQPEAFATRYMHRVPSLRAYSVHIDAAARMAAGKLLGRVAAAMPAAGAAELLAPLATAAAASGKGVKLEEQEGALLATGYVLAQCCGGPEAVTVDAQRSAVASLSSVLLGSDAWMASTAALALGHVALTRPLADLLPEPVDKTPTAASPSAAAAVPSVTATAAVAAPDASPESKRPRTSEAGAAEEAAVAAVASPMDTSADAAPADASAVAVAGGEAGSGAAPAVVAVPEVTPAAAAAAAPAAAAAAAAAAAVAALADVGGAGMRQLVDKMSELMAGKDVKVAVRAITAAGLLCHGVFQAQPLVGAAPGAPTGSAQTQALLSELLQAFFKLSGSKAEDVQFAVGEAISFAFGSVDISAATILATNFTSLSEEFSILKAQQQQQQQKQQEGAAAEAASAMDVDGGAAVAAAAAAAPEEVPQVPEPGSLAAVRAATQKEVTDRILGELIFHTRVETRCAATIWLVSLLTYTLPYTATPVAPPPAAAGGGSNRLLSLLPDIQDAFSNLLGDTNDLTQEMASRGVSIVYSLGGAATREKLVAALVGVLSGTAKTKQTVKVSGDTQVFEEGQVGTAPGGGSISTYKELCALATDLGQPDLVYKFMDLAQHNAALNSRRGAAFGFAGIAHLAGKQLTTHVAALIPKLYRYQYDPNPRVQEAMAAIWRALVDDPKKAMEEHFGAVMVELLREAGGRLWRNRQASCAAMADLLAGRSWAVLRPHLDGVWTMMLRCMDDIKDSVRTAAQGLSRSVRSLTLRLVDPVYSTPTDARDAVSVALPLLLEKGLGSSVAEVRAVGLDTIAKLSKAAGQEALRPHLGPLVTAMLEALSNLEDSRLNYIEQHAERMGFDNDRLEGARVSASRSSPMGDTLDLCARFADPASLDVLVPVLAGIVRRGVGLNTKVGTARFIRSLATRAGADMRTQAPALIKALVAATRAERSNTVRKAYAGAAAQVAKYASDKRVEKLVTEALALYSDPAGDKDGRLVGGMLLRELLRAAPEAFQANAAAVLPLAFGAKMDDDTDVAAAWKEVWEEGVSSEAAAIRLYTSEIVAVVLEGLASQQWGRKKACAEAVVQLAEAGGDVLGSHSVRLATALVAECGGRLWDGKEKVLDALGALAKACPVPLGADLPGGHAGIVDALLTAVGRKKVTWRAAALRCLLAALKAFPGYHYGQVSPPLLEACRKHCEAAPAKAAAAAAGTTAAPVTAADEAEAAEEKPLPLVESLDCLAAAFSKAGAAGVDQAAVGAHGDELSEVLAAVLAANQGWQPRLAAVSAVQALVKVSHQVVSSLEVSTPWLVRLLPGLLCALSEIKVLQVRMASLTALSELLEAADGGRRLTHELQAKVGAAAQELATAEADRNGALALAAGRIRDAIAAVVAPADAAAAGGAVSMEM